MEYTLKFNVTDKHCYIKSGDKTVLEIQKNDLLELSFFYSFENNPLILKARADIGDSIEIAIKPTHIIVWVNGELLEEDWPAGDISMENWSCDNLNFTLEEGARAQAFEPRKGILTKELRREGVNVGDCMPYCETRVDGRYHLLWLYDRHHHWSKWGFGAHQWAHASTEDLIHWDEHPIAIPITEQIEGSICTGSVIYVDNKFYAWYAIRMADHSPARITYATSNDGISYEKSNKYFTVPEQYEGKDARDPKVIFFEGRYHMLITTKLNETNKGCLAHLVSDYPDMRDFEDLGTILVTNDMPDGWCPECADYFEMGGRYYLTWSGRYAFSDKPFGEGGWTIPENCLLNCGEVPKAAFCPWNGELVFAGFIKEGYYAGELILKKATQLPDGRLELSDIK